MTKHAKKPAPKAKKKGAPSKARSSRTVKPKRGKAKKTKATTRTTTTKTTVTKRVENPFFQVFSSPGLGYFASCGPGYERGPFKTKAKATAAGRKLAALAAKLAKRNNPILQAVTLAGLANPSGGKLRVGDRVRWADMPESVKRNPVARSAALGAAKLAGVPLEDLEGEVCRVAKGTSPHLISSGELVGYSYMAPSKSKRARTASGRRIVWDHAAGDHGKGKPQTTPPLLTTDPRSGLPVIAARKGSRPGLSRERGHVG